MKRILTVVAAFLAVALLTVAAQAESKGEQVFKQKCSMCHKVNGTGGSVGPDLSKLSARMKEQDIKGKVENPKKSNPSSPMPSFKTLSKTDMDGLLGYLKTLK